jgi:hypothetical protein
MTDLSLEGARASYVAALRLVHPLFDEQLSDIVLLLDSLVGQNRPSHGSALDSVRADYLARLRDSGRSLDEQLFDLATACTHLFAPVLGLPPVAQ